MAEQSRPVVTASRTLGALSIVAGLVPLGVSAFGWAEWNVDQLEAYLAISGGVIAALAMFLGVSVEKRVTPMTNPRDDGLVPLVPIANDGLED